MNSTVRNHLEARRLEERKADDQELTGFWQKVLTAYADAMNAGGSPANQLLRAYDAARIAAFAIMRAAGFRTRGGESHHYVTFDVAQSLVDDKELRHALNRMDGFRRVRHAIEYEAHDDADEEKVDEAIHLARQIIVHGRQWLQARRPHVSFPSPG